jgi:UDP-glucuronate 4-epimerase
VPSPDPSYDSANPEPGTSAAPYRVFNIGNSDPVDLMEFIAAIERATGRKAEKELLPMQPGDVPATYADTKELEEVTGFRPGTPIDAGVRRFVDWFCGYYSVSR